MKKKTLAESAGGNGESEISPPRGEAKKTNRSKSGKK